MLVAAGFSPLTTSLSLSLPLGPGFRTLLRLSAARLTILSSACLAGSLCPANPPLLHLPRARTPEARLSPKAAAAAALLSLYGRNASDVSRRSRSGEEGTPTLAPFLPRRGVGGNWR